MLTPDYLNYNPFRMTPRQELFTFTVRACHSASVALAFSGHHDQSPDLEVIIGDDRNRKSVIRDMRNGQGVVLDVATPGILHCYEVNAFWINWRDGSAKSRCRIAASRTIHGVEDIRIYQSYILDVIHG